MNWSIIYTYINKSKNNKPEKNYIKIYNNKIDIVFLLNIYKQLF